MQPAAHALAGRALDRLDRETHPLPLLLAAELPVVRPAVAVAEDLVVPLSQPVAQRRIPLERLLVETDCPFLAPVPHRGKRNEPAYVAFTATRLAELRGESLGDIERVTTANARRALHLNNGPPSGIQGTP